MSKIQVGLIMGSQSDWSTMKEAADILSELGVHMKQKLFQRTELQVAMEYGNPLNKEVLR